VLRISSRTDQTLTKVRDVIEQTRHED